MGNEREFKDLPEGWKWVRLEEVIEDIADGGTPSRDNPEYFNGNINWLVVDDIQRKIVKTRETITAKGLKHSNAKLWKKGTIILSFGATIGEVGIAEIELATKQGIAGIVPQKDKLLNTFLYYVLKHNKHILLRYANQTTIMEVRPSIIKEKFKFPLPPLPEQQKIAEILETVDNAIEKTDKIIEKYKRIKQGLMQDLLTKGIDESGNIRDEKTHKFKSSPLGRIPEEWEVVRLGEVVEIHDNKRIPLSEEERVNRKGIYPYCGANGIIDHIDNYIFEGDYILLAEDGGFFGRFENSAYLMSGKFWVNNHAHVLKAREGISVDEFILAWLVFDDISKYISGTTRQKLNQCLMKNILIPLPPIPEQQKIAEILSQTDQTIEKEEQYKEKLERIKKGLMEDLLTGKLRVNNLIKED
jgi:type I restriction enzyme S subunit